jgi:hypothetical protein
MPALVALGRRRARLAEEVTGKKVDAVLRR